MNLSNENIIHIKTENIEYIQFRRLLEFKSIVHCYTLSTNSFDFAGNDTMEIKKQEVINNYKLLCDNLKIDFNHIVRPYQTHTSNVEIANKEMESIDLFESYKEVDGLVTDKEDIILSLGFADCTPIFLFDTKKNVIGNIHSGWKGTLQEIAKKAVIKMKEEYGSNVEDIIACIGPCIKECHFEVKEDVKDLFYNKFERLSHIQEIIKKKDLDHFTINTTAINIALLQEAGLKKENIIDSKICTACNSHVMHSYRIDGEKSGRNTSIIMRRKNDFTK